MSGKGWFEIIPGSHPPAPDNLARRLVVVSTDPEQCPGEGRSQENWDHQTQITPHALSREAKPRRRRQAGQHIAGEDEEDANAEIAVVDHRNRTKRRRQCDAEVAEQDGKGGAPPQAIKIHPSRHWLGDCLHDWADYLNALARYDSEPRRYREYCRNTPAPSNCRRMDPDRPIDGCLHAAIGIFNG